MEQGAVRVLLVSAGTDDAAAVATGLAAADGITVDTATGHAAALDYLVDSAVDSDVDSGEDSDVDSPVDNTDDSADDNAVDSDVATDIDCIAIDVAATGESPREFLARVRAERPAVPIVSFGTEASPPGGGIASATAEYVDVGADVGAVDDLVDGIRAAIGDDAVEPRPTEAWYEALLAATSDVILVLDATADVRYANPTVRHVLGHDPDDVVGRSVFEYVHEDDRISTAEQFFRFTADDAADPSLVEFRVRTADGDWVLMEAIGRDRLETEPLDGYVVSAWEVTARRRQEQELAEFETIADTAPVGLFTLDENGVITWANEMYAETLGLPKAAFVGEPFLDLVERGYYDESVPDRYLDNVRELLSSETDVDQQNFLVESARFDDERRVYDTYLTLLPMPDGEFRGTIHAFRDVTKQEAYQRELERQNERLDEFTSMVSHDLRNPLSIAKARTELALETGDVSHLADVQRAHERMEALVDDLLALAREGRSVEEPTSTDLAAVAQRAWDTVTEDATGLDREDGLGRILADPERLQQVLENLFRNALDHARPERDAADLTVTVGRLPGGFFVADDGRGIPADERDDVFRHGYSTTDDGTGYGLAIVETLVEAHDWSVSVAESADGGARFEIRGVERPAD